jgi:hypothetical protein
MTYSITKSDGSFLVDIDVDNINTTASSLTLFGQDVKNYGQYVNQNFVNLINNFSNNSAPVTPLYGQIWYDNSTRLLKVYNGSLWQTISPPFDGTSGILKISVIFYNVPVTVIATVVNNQILSVDSSYQIDNEFLQETVSYENTQFVFKSLFPNGLGIGTTLAITSNVVLEFHGRSYSTSVLTDPKTIGFTGDFAGNVVFDGSTDVNIAATFSNLYVGNSNVIVNGVYSNVTVDHTGRIVNLGNITYDNVIAALGYAPYSDANASVDNVPNTLVIRDQTGSFSANLITATTTYTGKFTSNVTIGTSGDVDGYSSSFNGSSNVIIATTRTTPSNLVASVYNSVTVNNKGIIESGQLVEYLPVGSIILYNNSVVIPEGWAPCNGGNLVTPSGQTVITPNLTNAAIGGTTYIIKVFKNIYLPSNDTVVGSLSVNLAGGGVPTITFVGGPDIKYPPLVFSNVNVATTSASINTYTKIKTVRIPSGYKGAEGFANSTAFNGRNYQLNDIVYFDFPNFNERASAKVTEITSNGGISKIQVLLAGKYIPFAPGAIGISANSLKSVGSIGGNGQDAEFDLEVERIQQPIPIQDVDFKDNLFFDAVSMVLSGGDPNAVMLSQADIFGDLSNLTVIQLINNLTTRRLTGLPPRIGKYMLSIDDIINYSGVLQIPVNATNFTIALQNRLMLLKVTDFSNEFSYLGFYPSDDKLFGACYFGFPQFVAVMKGLKTDTVGNTLLNAGLSVTGMNTIDNITNELMLTYCSKMIVNAKVAIYNNRLARSTAIEINNLTKSNTIPVPNALIVTPLLTTGNANIIVSESVIDGIPVLFGGTKPNINANVAFGGGSFVLGSPQLNDSVYTTLNGIRYGYYGSGGSSGSGGSGGSDRSSATDLSTGTGTKVPTGGVTLNAGAPVGGSASSPSIQPGSGYYGALFGQESANNYSAFYGNYGENASPYGDITKLSIAEVYALQDKNLNLKGGTAVGVGQFLKGTLQDMVNSPEAQALGITVNSDFTVEVQNQLLGIFAGKNAQTLTAKNIPTTDANLAGAHLLGSGGFNTLYSADPNVTVDQLFSASTINLNPGIMTVNGKPLNQGGIPRTAAQVQAYFNARYGTGQTWRLGVKLASNVVPAVPTTPQPPTASTGLPQQGTITVTTLPNTVSDSDLAKGVTAVATALASALSPPSAITQVVSAIVPQSVKQLAAVGTAVAQNATAILEQAGAVVLANATNILNKALESAGQQKPAINPSTTTGGTTVTPTKVGLLIGRDTPTPNNSNQGLSMGTPSAPFTGQTVTIAKPSSDFSSGSGTKLSYSSSTTGGQSAASGVQSSGASLSFGSSVGSATASSGSSATYSLGTPASKPTSGGTGSTPVNTGGAFSLKGCFVFDTLIDMLDGSVKKIGELRLGDQIRGGEVVAVHCYDGAPLYNYKGVHVSGTHYVIENGTPLMVKDSAYSVKIDDVYGLYTVDTTGRRIFANDIEFADHNGDGVIFEFFKNSKTRTFDTEQDILDEVLSQVKQAKI